MAFPRVRGAALLAISALVGLVVTLAVFYVVERRAAVSTVPVLVAARPIAKGATLEPAMVRLVEWPAHLKGFEAETSVSAVSGRLARVDLYAGEPVLSGKLRQRGERGDLNDQLAAGERAMSVRVNDIVGVPAANFVDHHVDLLLTSPGTDATGHSQLVAERVRVLAVNDTGTTERPQPIRTLTVAVALEQAKAIDDARNLGTLTALLRNPRDTGVTRRAGAAGVPAVGNAAEAPAGKSESPTRVPRQAGAEPRSVEVILGTQQATP